MTTILESHWSNRLLIDWSQWRRWRMVSYIVIRKRFRLKPLPKTSQTLQITETLKHQEIIKQ